jgi:hypothetical protein
MWNVENIADSFTMAAPINAAKMMHNKAVASLIRDTLSDFSARGVRINESSRLHRYASLFETVLGEKDCDALHEQLDSALLETLQFEAIRRSMGGLPECLGLSASLLQATGGNVDSSLDRADCKARSTQFELFVWACLRAAGCEATLAEPDILCQTEIGNTLAIAAKRPRSEKKIIKNLRSGCHQIEKLNCDGFVALDLTFVESLCKPIFVREASQLLVPSMIILDGFVGEYAQEICNAVRGSCVIGVLFYYSVVVRAIRDPARLVSRRWIFLQTRKPPLDAAAMSLIRRFQNLLHAGGITGDRRGTIATHADDF